MDAGWFRCIECSEVVRVETHRRKVFVRDGHGRAHTCGGYPDGYLESRRLEEFGA